MTPDERTATNIIREAREAAIRCLATVSSETDLPLALDYLQQDWAWDIANSGESRRSEIARCVAYAIAAIGGAESWLARSEADAEWCASHAGRGYLAQARHDMESAVEHSARMRLEAAA